MLRIPVTRPVESFVGDFVGARARGCGRHSETATRDALQQSIACALSASTLYAPFAVIVQRHGLDSRHAAG
jgi:hypothetical protein